MATWQTPKTDYTPVDGIFSTDFNRIEGNIEGLRCGHNDLGDPVAAAECIDVTKNFHVVTGASGTQIKFISVAGFLPGAEVFLLFQNSIVLYAESPAPPTGYKSVSFPGAWYGCMNVTDLNHLLHFYYDGTFWRCTETLISP